FWLTGMEYQSPLESRLWLSLLAALVLWTLCKGGRAAWFFFLQACLPWLGVIVVWEVTGRSLLQTRYFVFAGVGLFGLWGMVWHLLPGMAPRAVVFLGLGLPVILGLAEHLRQTPQQTPALAQCAAWLKDHYREDDLFLLDDYRDI